MVEWLATYYREARMQPEVWLEQNYAVRHDVMQQAVQVYDKSRAEWVTLQDYHEICASVEYYHSALRNKSPSQMHDLLLSTLTTHSVSTLEAYHSMMALNVSVIGWLGTQVVRIHPTPA